MRDDDNDRKKKNRESQGRGPSGKNLDALLAKNGKDRQKNKRRRYSPIPVLLVLIGSSVFVRIIVDQCIGINLLSDDLWWVKIQTEEIGWACQFNLLGFRKDRKAWLGKTRGSTLPTNLRQTTNRIKQLRHERKQEMLTLPDRSSLADSLHNIRDWQTNLQRIAWIFQPLQHWQYCCPPVLPSWCSRWCQLFLSNISFIAHTALINFCRLARFSKKKNLPPWVCLYLRSYKR